MLPRTMKISSRNGTMSRSAFPEFPQRGLAFELRRQSRIEKDPHDDEAHVERRQDDTRHEAGSEKLSDRCFREGRVDDHRDRRRDQDAQRAAGRQGSRDETSIVAAGRELGQSDGGHGGGRRRASARDGREDATARDIGVHETTGQPAHKGRNAVVKPCAEAGAQEDFGHQHEQGNGGKGEAVGGAPTDDAESLPAGETLEQPDEEQSGAGHRELDPHATENQADQQPEREETFHQSSASNL